MDLVTSASAQQNHDPVRFREELDFWSTTALEHDWVEAWREGAIFPREMVAFLAFCASLGINSFVESGRQHGYSTELLAEFVTQRGGRVTSIDVEIDDDMATETRRRLAKYSNLDLIRGNAFHKLAAALRATAPESTALLVDGPKGFPALSLIFSSAVFGHVTVGALHNVPLTTAEGRLAVNRTQQRLHYEDLVGAPADSWTSLAAREQEFCSSIGARRSLSASTLGMFRLDTCRHRVMRTVTSSMWLYQPPFVARCWKRGWDGVAGRLFEMSLYLGATSQRVWSLIRSPRAFANALRRRASRLLGKALRRSDRNSQDPGA